MFIYKINYGIVIKVGVRKKRHYDIDSIILDELYRQIYKHREDETGIRDFLMLEVENLISETKDTMGPIREIDFECWATVCSDIGDYRKKVLIYREVYLDKNQFDDLMESVVEAVMKDNCLWETNDEWWRE